MTSPPPLDDRADDLCAREEIQHPGMIQPHGVLLAVDPSSFQIVVASANASDLLDAGPEGRTLADVLTSEFADELATRAAAGDLPVESPWETTLILTDGSLRLDVASHLHNGVIVVELEPPDEREGEKALIAARLLQRAVSRLRGAGSNVETLASVAVAGIRAISGYERVLVYRFDERWDGEAIAEDKVDDWDQSFLSLHFPASDIPRQARELYARSPLRWVPCRDYQPVPLSSDPGWRPGDAARPFLRAPTQPFAHTPSVPPQHGRRRHHVSVGSTRRAPLGIGRLPSPRTTPAVGRSTVRCGRLDGRFRAPARTR